MRTKTTKTKTKTMSKVRLIITSNTGDDAPRLFELATKRELGADDIGRGVRAFAAAVELESAPPLATRLYALVRGWVRKLIGAERVLSPPPYQR